MTNISSIVVKEVSSLRNSNFPDFIRNRYDILYNENRYLEITYNDKIYFIPFHVEFITCKLALWLVEIPYEILNAGVKYIFQNYKFIFIIKVLSSINPYPKDNFSNKEINYWIDLPETTDEYFMFLKRKTRSTCKRHIKKLTNDVGKYELIKYDKEDIQVNLVQEYFKLKKLTLNKSYRISAKKYLKKYCITSAYVLRIKNENIAIAFIVETGENVYLENITYNPKYFKYSVGTTLCLEIISDLIKIKKKRFYLGCSNKDDYKCRLSNCSRETYSLKIKSQISILNCILYFCLEKLKNKNSKI